MTTRVLLAMALMCVSAEFALAQEPRAMELAIPQEYLSPPEMPIDANPRAEADAGTKFWVRPDGLLWRMTRPPIAVPLISGNLDPTAIGALNETGTTILFGAGSDQDVNFGVFSGFKVTIGGWWEENNMFGWDGNVFLLERRPFRFSAESAGGTAPIVSIPFNATQAFGINPAGETALNSGGAPTNALVQMYTRLWGAEANYLIDLWSNNRFYCTAVVGFRYIDLNESLLLTYTNVDTATNGTVAVTDGFSTRNQYYAGQIGARFGLSNGRWQVAAASTVAFGIQHQVANVFGATFVNGGAFGFADGATPGGVFTQPSNIGTTSREFFSVVPEVQLKVGYALTPTIRAFAGYNAMFVSNVLRPGNQIDRNINPTQNAFFVPPGTLTGTAAPLPLMRGSDLWAHGVQLGVEFQW